MIAKNRTDVAHDGSVSKTAGFTIGVIGLDRWYYTKKHRDHLIKLAQDYMILFAAQTGGHTDEVERYEAKFRMYVSGKSELAALARAFARFKRLEERFNIPIPCGAEE